MTGSNIFRKCFLPTACALIAACALPGALCAAGGTVAAGQNRSLSQYVHDRWDARSGFTFGEIFAISQSDDGYLWIGTEQGLVRFDGSTFTLVDRPIPGLPPLGPVRGLVEDKQGTLWIRCDSPRLLRYRNGVFQDAFRRAAHQPLVVTSMFPSAKQGVLLWGAGRWGYHMDSRALQVVADPSQVLWVVLSLAASPAGERWLGTSGNGLFERAAGHHYDKIAALGDSKINALAAAGTHDVWIGTDNGLLRLHGRQIISSRLRGGPLQRLQILSLLADPSGSVWAGTNHGLLRVPPSVHSAAQFVDPGSADEVNAVFIDREGELWYGGADGLERLRAGAFRTWSAAQGLPAEIDGPIYADSDGTVWFAPRSGGLYRLRDGHLGQVTLAGLEQDVVYSISGAGDEVWLGRQRGGLTCLTKSGNGYVARTYTTRQGLAENSVYSVLRARDGTVWAGTVSAGVSRLRNGVFTNYSVGQGLPSTAVNAIAEGLNGTIWAAAPNGLVSFTNGRWKPIPGLDKLPSSDVLSLFEDSGHVLWIATSGGLAFVTGGRLTILQDVPGVLRDQILGIAADDAGHLWIATSSQVLRVSLTTLLTGSVHDYDLRRYGIEDGLTGVEGVNRDRSVMADAQGRIWISLTRGLAMTDPRSGTDASHPLQVRIDSVIAPPSSLLPGRTTYRIPADSNAIGFTFSAATFEDPEDIRFRYRLDSADQSWSPAVETRQVTYRNLDPGHYQFQVQTSRNGDLWSSSAAGIPFDIERAYWQTWWFRTLCIASAILLIAAMYRMRTWQLTRQLNARFQERLAERNRIAQELHDTLLQGFISASMQVDLAEDRIPADSPAKPLLQRALQLMREVTEEGRNALRGLRTPNRPTHTLEMALSRVGEELTPGRPTEFHVKTESTTRTMRPFIVDEVYHIGREAIVNSFKHSRATSVEVEVEYAVGRFRLLVRDNGSAIDPAVLQDGKDGHWGLSGMRERSERMGAMLKLRSRSGVGTEVELVVPGSIAFAHSSRGIWRSRRGKHRRQPMASQAEGDSRDRIG